MILSLLALLSLATCIQAKTLSSNEAIAAFIAKLNKTVTIDLANPPYMDKDKETFPVGCTDLLCIHVPLWKRTLLRTVDHVDILYTAHSEKPRLNTGPRDMTFQFTSSTAIMESTTWGWNIGVQLSYSNQVLTVGYSHENAYSRTVTTTESDTITCPSNYECTIKTLTFYTIVHGTCVTQQYVTCAGTYNVCDHATQPCYELQPVHDNVCKTPYPMLPCSIQVPILDTDKNPVTAKVIVAEKIKFSAKRSRGQRLSR
ncbi:uncharacterized protein UV8b_05250 [Ustilaginoidea virens]|uniref:Uncharacterized protein n=1 Tax=Ustilaginoidea virens TaxID=1159556 RepID=A0A063CAV2_USTVR|nr:uncharacterized protein UV8b_05250 [Ustilaginoidea virens]QUC21009.1 hypothetical protein UV8b_05250 [Ustilaginoidea virens]GAO20111.1 hypothetical protein UVI_02008760 [Ustilaginoidea virens]